MGSPVPDTRHLAALVKLVDDESSTVREAVLKELAGFGPELETLLRELDAPPDETRITAVLSAVEAYRSSFDGEPATEAESPRPPLFAVGQLVRHKRYGYRGVVVAADVTCQADDAWYLANRTRPRRRQPWYHVLVHNSAQVTYAAQTSLLPDESMDRIVHPQLSLYFEGFEDGAYRRNDLPWPGWERRS